MNILQSLDFENVAEDYLAMSQQPRTAAFTLAELSTASHIQVVLAYLQLSARLGARVPLKTLCATASV